ncbi:MAG: hypothetical protein SFV23_00870 [Planctomycetaceae bacterium]|nr:hypothetical protein [Planctomycetaceae bacterium]
MTTPKQCARPHQLPDRYVRTDLDDLSNVTASSDLDLHIVRLLALHPLLKVRFRNQDLAGLDDATKQTLLDDMNQVLGIKRLKKRPAC